MDVFSTEAIRSAMDTGGDEKLRQTLRAACRRSLYTTVKLLVCYAERPNLMSEEVFKESCDWLQWVFTTKKRGLFEDPRSHIKTFRCSIGGPVWLGIQQPHDEYDHPAEIDRAREFLMKHPHIKGVDSRYVIASDSKERAASFTKLSKEHWQSNPLLKWLFPEYDIDRLAKKPTPWKDTGYLLPNRINTFQADPFLRAVGLESKEQGGRAEGIIIDDLVGETSYRSETELGRRRGWLDTIGNLLVNMDPKSPMGGFIIVNENRWALNDVNGKIHEELLDWAIWRRSAYRCYVHLAGNCGRWSLDKDGENVCAPTEEPLWKERYPDTASMERVRIDRGDEVFAIQWMNDPTIISDLDYKLFRDFYTEIRVYDSAMEGGDKRTTRGWCIIVPGDADKGVAEEVIPLTALSKHLISIDPATSTEGRACRTAISWFGYDSVTSRSFWIDCRADRWAPDDSVREAYKLFTEAREKISAPPRIVIEKVGAQSFMAAAIRNHALTQGDRVGQIDLIPPKQGYAKEDRIVRRVGARLNQGKLYLRLGLPLPRTEVRHFPTGTKDTLDTCAQAEEIFLEMRPRGSSNRRHAFARRRARKEALARSTPAGTFM